MEPLRQEERKEAYQPTHSTTPSLLSEEEFAFVESSTIRSITPTTADSATATSSSSSDSFILIPDPSPDKNPVVSRLRHVTWSPQLEEQFEFQSNEPISPPTDTSIELSSISSPDQQDAGGGDEEEDTTGLLSGRRLSQATGARLAQYTTGASCARIGCLIRWFLFILFILLPISLWTILFVLRHIVHASLQTPDNIRSCTVLPPLDHPAWSPQPFHDPTRFDEVYVQHGSDQRFMFMACPAGSHIQIESATYGDVCGLHPESMSMAKSPWNRNDLSELTTHQDEASLAQSVQQLVNAGFVNTPCLLDSTVLFRMRCNGARACCVNSVYVNPGGINCYTNKKNAIVTWKCESDSLIGNLITRLNSPPPSSEPIRNIKLGMLQEFTPQQMYDLAGFVSKIETQLLRFEEWLPSARKQLISSVTHVKPRICTLVFALHGPADGANGNGLTSQLTVLASILTLAYHANCNVSIDGFLPDYKRMNIVPFSSVINITAVSDRIRELVLHSHHELGQVESGETKVSIFEANSTEAFLAPTLMDTSTLELQNFHEWSRLPGCDRCSNLENWFRQSLDQPERYALFARLLRHHPNPGILLTRNALDEWANSAPIVFQHTRQLFAQQLQFTEPFIQVAKAIQQSLLLEVGEYMVIDYREKQREMDWLGLQRETIHTNFEPSLIGTLEKLRDESNAQEEMTPTSLLSHVENRTFYLSVPSPMDRPYLDIIRQQFPFPTIRLVTLGTLFHEHCHPHPKLPLTLDPPHPPSPHLETFGRLFASLPWATGLDPCQIIDPYSEYSNLEFYSILDTLISLDSGVFIGWTGSSLSRLVIESIQQQPKSFLRQTKTGTSKPSDTYQQQTRTF